MKHYESKLKSALLQVLKTHLPAFTILRHEDVRRGGIPDLSITGGGRTTWWEVKHAVPKLVGTERQGLVCRHLALRGFCRYIVYFEDDVKMTLILDPRILSPTSKGTHVLDSYVETCILEHDHLFVLDYIRKVHQAPNNLFIT